MPNATTPLSVPYRSVWAVLGLGCGLLAGCGESTAEISGTVRFDGRPLQAGTVTFFHPRQEGRNVVGNIRPDGTYRVTNCPTGTVKVAVQPLPPKVKSAAKAKPRGDVPPVPPKYNDPATSELAFEVTGDRQGFDIDLRP